MGAAKQLVVTTCFALGNLGQALAGSPLVEEFVASVKEVLAWPELCYPHDKGTHAPYPPELLALAVVSACTQPGVPQEARVQVDCPPSMLSDRHILTLLALAVGRWESSYSGQRKEEADNVSAALKGMLAVQEKLIRHRREQFGAPKGKNGKSDEEYERRVLPKLFAGDVSSVYTIGPLAHL